MSLYIVSIIRFEKCIHLFVDHHHALFAHLIDNTTWLYV